ncbi:MAG TPA: condensation domain-containing protein [Pilimelia sp.]|nr:condensation domain-containing protein [Pilimelia sp.]
MSVREAPASVGQRLLWLMDHYQGSQSSLTEQVLWRMHGPVDTGALAGALAALTERHETLRTTFVERRRQLLQLVHEPRTLGIAHVDLSGEADPDKAVRAAITADLKDRIDPERWPTRAVLYRLRDDEHVFSLGIHHLVTDDWSNFLITRDLRASYARLTGAAADLPPVGWQYARWAQWQREALGGESLQRLLRFWSKQLDGASLPMLPRRATGGPPLRRSAETNLPERTVEALRQVAKSQRTSLFPVMLAVFLTLLHSRTGQPDLTIASLFANRSREEVTNTVGFFVNMVALRGRIDDDTTFLDLVRQTRMTVIQALLHQDLPYQMLPPNMIRSATGRPDDVVFQMLDPATSRADVHGAELDDLEPQIERSRFDLEFALVPVGGTYVALMMYTSQVFDPPEAQRFVDEFAALAAALAEHPDALLTRHGVRA